ncbi:MAG TPA: adhesin, partial [Syntrophobacteraceae bacterium]|nr:adhesin [Syntrophobacteraceae bacterium]
MNPDHHPLPRTPSTSHPFNPLDYPSIFAKARRLTYPFSWVEHIPFAFFLVEALRPRVLVELGTHSGNSYCAMCQAVEKARLNTKCFAVDTWAGDEHSGLYKLKVLANLRAHHDQLYGNFSTLIQETFDAASTRFSIGSIDLLHIDGCHTYSAVKHDFETWLPKVNPNGVILFHDTNVHSDDFGVWRLWEELARQYPHFEYFHGSGLGILALSAEQPEPLLHLLNA